MITGLPREPRCESLSSIRTFQDCPRAYYYKYIENLKPPVQSSHFRMGRFVDHCLSSALAENEWKVPDKIPSDLLQTEWEDGTNEALIDWAESKIIAQRVLNFLYASKWRTVFLLKDSYPAVQLRLSQADKKLQGVIDWLARDAEGRLCLVDFKVSKNSPVDPSPIDFEQQLGFYAHLVQNAYFQEPLYLYQLRILGKNPKSPAIVKHRLSRKGQIRKRPEMGKILTTWELWQQAALSCGENPEDTEYQEQKAYLENIVWQCFVPIFCPEDVQAAHEKNLLAWKSKIDSLEPEAFGLRNLRNYMTGPCNSTTVFSKRCHFLEPCQADLLNITRPAWAKVKQ